MLELETAFGLIAGVLAVLALAVIDTVLGAFYLPSEGAPWG
jgi:hypothetical protein